MCVKCNRLTDALYKEKDRQWLNVTFAGREKDKVAYQIHTEQFKMMANIIRLMEKP